MGAPAKKRAQAEKQPQGSSKGSSSASRDPTQRSIPRLDGNRDPAVAPTEYTRPTDLKNISEFLGLAGWYAARGVSANTLVPRALVCKQDQACSSAWRRCSTPGCI
jgi:eukaryotic translation initiation factor 2C